MTKAAAATPAAYLESLPPDRREVVAAVRDVVLRHMPKGYVETVAYGMLSWVIPLADYPDTYNGQPLVYLSLTAQKHHYALYMMCVYGSPALERKLRDAFDAAGLKLDMGKSCVRFRRIEDLPLPAIGKILAAVPPKSFIAHYEASRRR